MTPVLKLEGISKQYPGVTALDKVDFELEAGEVRALLGKNGAGKSTLIKVLSGAVHPDSGTITIDGQPVRILHPADAFAQGICTVYQEMSLVPGLSVAENILLGRWQQRKIGGIFKTIDYREIRKQAKAALDQLGVEIDLNAPVSRLSIAQQQLVEIAKAISFNPRVLVLDEPTSALAAEEVLMLHKVIKRLTGQGRAVIYVTHRLQEVPLIADQVTVFRNGKSMGTISVKEATAEKIADMMIGSDWQSAGAAKKRTASGTRGASALKARGLTRAGEFEGVSFELHAGEVVGIAGLLGAGRTELLRALFGLAPLDSGEIVIKGEVVNNPSPIRMIQHGMGMAPEDRKRSGLILPQSVRQNVSIASLTRFSRGGIMNLKHEQTMARGTIDDLLIKTPSDQAKTMTLSGGNQQKVVVGKWLNIQPSVLLLDEPTRGIDIQAKEQIFELMRQLAGRGVAILFVSSEIEEVMTADRILIMVHGRITGETTPDQVDLQTLLSLVMGESAL